MQTAKDAKITAERYLSSEDGQLKGIISSISESAISGKFHIVAKDVSEYSMLRLKELGYSFDNDCIWWGEKPEIVPIFTDVNSEKDNPIDKHIVVKEKIEFKVIIICAVCFIIGFLLSFIIFH